MTVEVVLLFLNSFLFQETISECVDLSTHKNYHLLDLGSKCGYNRIDPSGPRVVGGADAMLGELPWMARVIISNGYTKRRGKCGGSLINNRYVLSAAHCFAAPRNQDASITAQVVLGDHTLRTVQDCVGDVCAPLPVVVDVEKIIKHEKYDSNSLINDIALLRLKENINFTDFVSPICLPLSCQLMERDLSTTSVLVAGWGLTKIEGLNGYGDDADNLQKLQVRTAPAEWCYCTENLHPSQICGNTTQQHTTAEGDSGGPVMYEPTDPFGPPQYILYGVNSHGMGCEFAGDNGKHMDTHDVYTRVTSFLEWILDNLDD